MSATDSYRAALQLIARGYTGDVGNCEGLSGTACAEIARAALANGQCGPEYLPQEPPYEVLKALAGDPVILAASDEEELRRRYGVMRDRLLGATKETT